MARLAKETYVDGINTETQADILIEANARIAAIAAEADLRIAGDALAIPKSLVDAAGDILVGTANDTPGRLAKGANGKLLGVAAGALAWVDPPVTAPVTKYSCKVLAYTDVQIPASQFYVVPFAHESDYGGWDPDGMHSTSPNPERINILRSGIYIVSYQLCMPAGIAQMEITIRKNGNVYEDTDRVYYNVDAYFRVFSGTKIMKFNVGDYIELYAKHFSGSAQNLDGARYSYFSVSEM